MTPTPANNPRRLEMFRTLRESYKTTLKDLADRVKEASDTIKELEAALAKANHDLSSNLAEIVSTKSQYSGVTAIIREMEDAQREQERLAQETEARIAREAEDTELGEL